MLTPYRIRMRQFGATGDKLLRILGKSGLLGDNPMFIVVCRDDPEVIVKPRLRYIACVTVDEDFPALVNGLDDYGTSLTGARQNAVFRATGSSTVTWQSYSPNGS